MRAQLLDQCFATLRPSGRPAFIPFLTAGDPDLATTGQFVDAAIAGGADIVEIGFPFSDPLADGAVIQASYTRALKNGIRLGHIFEAAATWHQRHPTVPLVGMASYSLVYRHGPRGFLEQLSRAGFAGLIVPDLPIEEGGELAAGCADLGLSHIQLVTPTTPRERAKQIVQSTTGFVYVVSVTGITGARTQVPEHLVRQLQWLRTITELPLCVGFGISEPEHVLALKGHCDGVIVGSALVRHLETLGQQSASKVLADFASHVQRLVAAIRA